MHSRPTLHVCKPLLVTAHCCWRKSVSTSDETVSRPKLTRLHGQYGVLSHGAPLELLSFPGRMNGIEADTRLKIGILGSRDVTEAQSSPSTSCDESSPRFPFPPTRTGRGSR